MAKKLAVLLAVLLVGVALGSLVGPALGEDPSAGRGTAGAGGAEETKVVVSKDFKIAHNNNNGGLVFCPQRYEAIGGGVDTGGFATMILTGSAPVFGSRDHPKGALDKGKGKYPAATGWRGAATNTDDETRPVNISVICTRK